MKRLVFMARLVTTAISASFGVLVHRALHGPTLPTWTWSEEFLVAVSRSVLTAGARDVSLMTPRGGGPKPPLSRNIRNALDVGNVDLSGIRGERYCPKTRPSGTMRSTSAKRW